MFKQTHSFDCAKSINLLIGRSHEVRKFVQIKTKSDKSKHLMFFKSGCVMYVMELIKEDWPQWQI